jgi:hypothetical protein
LLSHTLAQNKKHLLSHIMFLIVKVSPSNIEIAHRCLFHHHQIYLHLKHLMG